MLFLKKKPTIEIKKEGDETVIRYNDLTYSSFKDGTLFIGAYWDYFSALPLLFHHPKILIIGLGAGTIAYQIENLYQDVDIEGIEIEEEMIKIAASKLKKTSIIKGDGFELLKSRENKDIIIMDAYQNDAIPEKFTSEEFFSLSYTKLKDPGVLAINLALTVPNLRLRDRILNYASKYFKVYILQKVGRSFNEILVCAKNIDIIRKFNEIQDNDLIKINKELVNIVNSYRKAIVWN